MSDEARLRAFYRDPAVRDRIADYLGRLPGREPTALYVAYPMPSLERPLLGEPVESVWELLDGRLEAARSLWDRASLLMHVDLEHVHFDRPWEPLADRERSERLQAPLVAAFQEILAGHGIEPLHLLTGRGHHLVWRVERDSLAFRTLVSIGRPGTAVLRLYRTEPWPRGDAVGESVGAAHHGLGKVLEYLAHEAVRRAASAVPIPLALTAVTPARGPAGREVISIDLSAFGDPLHARTVRIPFTAYRKALQLGAPPEIVARTLVVVPMLSDDRAESLAAMGDLERAARLAARVSVAIPERARGTVDLIEAYLASDLRRFHDAFELGPDGIGHFDPEDAVDLAAMPHCVRRILEFPNDLLLQPAALQLAVRVLTAQGWSARRVARLVESKLARDYGWIQGLHFHEPGVRAEFYTRLFAGAIATGLDTGADLDCVSTREKWLCPGAGCGWDLNDFVPGRHRLG